MKKTKSKKLKTNKNEVTNVCCHDGDMHGHRDKDFDDEGIFGGNFCEMSCDSDDDNE